MKSMGYILTDKN